MTGTVRPAPGRCLRTTRARSSHPVDVRCDRSTGRRCGSSRSVGPSNSLVPSGTSAYSDRPAWRFWLTTNLAAATGNSCVVVDRHDGTGLGELDQLGAEQITVDDPNIDRLPVAWASTTAPLARISIRDPQRHRRRHDRDDVASLDQRSASVAHRIAWPTPIAPPASTRTAMRSRRSRRATSAVGWFEQVPARRGPCGDVATSHLTDRPRRGAADADRWPGRTERTSPSAITAPAATSRATNSDRRYARLLRSASVGP